jgi:hypothetical protein
LRQLLRSKQHTVSMEADQFIKHGGLYCTKQQYKPRAFTPLLCCTTIIGNTPLSVDTACPDPAFTMGTRMEPTTLETCLFAVISVVTKDSVPTSPAYFYVGT